MSGVWMPKATRRAARKAARRAGDHQYLRIELLHAVLALDEHHACRKDEEGVGHIEQGCIKDGLRTEDARYDRVADEAHVGKHQGKAYHALVVMVLGDEAWHPEAEYQ